MSLDVNILSKITISNPLEMNHKSNEDVLDVDETGSVKRIVVCDGAGAAGVFCGDWAKTVARAVPDDPEELKSNFETWYQGIGKTFHDHITSSKDLSDPVLLSKFYQQGSLTTLLALWIDTENRTYSFAGIGDSMVFHFQKRVIWELKCVFPVNEIKSIYSNPKLLRWNVETIAFPAFDEQPIYEDSIFILCSDSMARWILIMLDLINPVSLIQAGVSKSFRESLYTEIIRSKKEIAFTHLQLHDSNELLNYLRLITQSEADFRNSALNLIKSGSLDEDDLTISIIEVNVS
jgi:hypothetical protein